MNFLTHCTNTAPAVLTIKYILCVTKRQLDGFSERLYDVYWRVHLGTDVPKYQHLLHMPANS